MLGAMPLICAVYGYECTSAANFGDFELIPRYTDLSLARERARDKTALNLTAVLYGASLTSDIAFQMEAVLSFIEHLAVVVLDPTDGVLGDPFDHFPASLPAHGRHDGGGAVLMSDVFFGNSRAAFIRQCMQKLSDDEFIEQTKFSDLLYRVVETFRQRRPHLEVSYYLLFSALESHARAVTADRKSGAAVPIARLLQQYGLQVYQDQPTDLARSISTYTHIRNAIFHNCELDAVVNIQGTNTTLSVLDYYSNLSLLLPLVAFKAIGYDDGHINWDRWIDRQAFK